MLAALSRNTPTLLSNTKFELIVSKIPLDIGSTVTAGTTTGIILPGFRSICRDVGKHSRNKQLLS